MDIVTHAPVITPGKFRGGGSEDCTYELRYALAAVAAVVSLFGVVWAAWCFGARFFSLSAVSRPGACFLKNWH